MSARHPYTWDHTMSRHRLEWLFPGTCPRIPTALVRGSRWPTELEGPKRSIQAATSWTTAPREVSRVNLPSRLIAPASQTTSPLLAYSAPKSPGHPAPMSRSRISGEKATVHLHGICVPPDIFVTDVIVAFCQGNLRRGTRHTFNAKIRSIHGPRGDGATNMAPRIASKSGDRTCSLTASAATSIKSFACPAPAELQLSLARTSFTSRSLDQISFWSDGSSVLALRIDRWWATSWLVAALSFIETSDALHAT